MAAQFQYMALVHYSQAISEKMKKTSMAGENIYRKKLLLETRGYALEDELNQLRAEVDALRRCEKDLKKWKDREPEIHHYLGLFATLAR